MKKQNPVSSIAVIKAILIIVVVGNLFAAILFLLFDSAKFIWETIQITGICAFTSILMLVITEICEKTNNRFWKIKHQVDDTFDSDYQLAKCSSSYYFLPILAVLLDLLLSVMFFVQSDAQERKEVLQNGDLTFPLLFLLFYNACAVILCLYYHAHKVFYSGRSLYITYFWKKEKLNCSEIEKIEIYHIKQENQKLVFVTQEKTISLSLKRLSDGWEDFVRWTCKTACQNHIPIIVHKQKR